MTALLAVEDVHTYYGASYVLQGVSLTLPAGGLVAVLGRNGVGKTTLMRSIMGFTPARQGRVLLGGSDVARWPVHRIARAGVSLVPQGRRVFASLSVRENLAIAERGEERMWSIATVLDLFPRLGERLDNPAGTLSGGEQQMLAVARALLGNPRLLLMDEPTEGLSPFVVEELAALIGRLKAGGMTILLIEQNIAFALELASHVYVMDKGRMVHDGPPQSLDRDPGIKERYLGL